MGCRDCYRAFEKSVIGLHNLGKLDKGSLSVLLEAYRGSDIEVIDRSVTFDPNYITKDFMDARETTILAFGEGLPDFPEDPTDEEREKYNEEVWEKFFEITGKFGW